MPSGSPSKRYARYYELPWPPSVNHYWRHVGSRVLISKAGRQYREAVAAVCGVIASSFPGRLRVEITAHPPDRRRRDLDNLPKAILDSLQHAGAYADDGQIDVLTVSRGEPEPGGRLVVLVMGA